jgi:hypothetical protein
LFEVVQVLDTPPSSWARSELLEYFSFATEYHLRGVLQLPKVTENRESEGVVKASSVVEPQLEGAPQPSPIRVLLNRLVPGVSAFARSSSEAEVSAPGGEASTHPVGESVGDNVRLDAQYGGFPKGDDNRFVHVELKPGEGGKVTEDFEDGFAMLKKIGDNRSCVISKCP